MTPRPVEVEFTFISQLDTAQRITLLSEAIKSSDRNLYYALTYQQYQLGCDERYIEEIAPTSSIGKKVASIVSNSQPELKLDTYRNSYRVIRFWFYDAMSLWKHLNLEKKRAKIDEILTRINFKSKHLNTQTYMEMCDKVLERMEESALTWNKYGKFQRELLITRVMDILRKAQPDVIEIQNEEDQEELVHLLNTVVQVWRSISESDRDQCALDLLQEIEM